MFSCIFTGVFRNRKFIIFKKGSNFIQKLTLPGCKKTSQKQAKQAKKNKPKTRKKQAKNEQKMCYKLINNNRCFVFLKFVVK